MKTIYMILSEMGAEMDHHESDLYVRRTPEVTEAIKEYRKKWPSQLVSTFTNERPPNVGEAWYELAFAYDPWWEARSLFIVCDV